MVSTGASSCPVNHEISDYSILAGIPSKRPSRPVRSFPHVHALPPSLGGQRGVKPPSTPCNAVEAECYNKSNGKQCWQHEAARRRPEATQRIESDPSQSNKALLLHPSHLHICPSSTRDPEVEELRVLEVAKGHLHVYVLLPHRRRVSATSLSAAEQ